MFDSIPAAYLSAAAVAFAEPLKLAGVDKEKFVFTTWAEVTRKELIGTGQSMVVGSFYIRP